MTAAAIQPDRRSTMRNKSLRRVQILDGAKLSTIDCLMRDVSESGARLSIPGFSPLPRAFELKIDGRYSTNRAWLVWQGNETLGVSFIDPASPAKAAPGMLRALKDENERLAAIVEVLTARLDRLTP